VTLGQPRAVGAEHEGHVGVRDVRPAEQRAHVQLARRRLDQIGSAHDLSDLLSCVVHHHGEIVCRGPVVAPYHEVVDDGAVLAAQAVGERHDGCAGAQTQRRRASRALALGPLSGCQLAAGARVITAGRRAVRRRQGFADLGTGAVAGVQQAVGVQARERCRVVLGALGLAHDRPVPVEAERGEVGQLRVREPGPATRCIEVLDAHDEVRAARAGEQPGQQRGAQVAEVQDARRRRGVAAGPDDGAQRAGVLWRGAAAVGRSPIA
jgi:hypothetical protein